DEGVVQVAEVGALPRAAGRVVLRVEVQDEPAPCQVGRVVDFTAGGSGAESGNRTADLNAQRTPGCGRSDALRRCEPNIPQAPAALTGGQQRGERAPAFAGEDVVGAAGRARVHHLDADLQARERRGEPRV